MANSEQHDSRHFLNFPVDVCVVVGILSLIGGIVISQPPMPVRLSTTPPSCWLDDNESEWVIWGIAVAGPVIAAFVTNAVPPEKMPNGPGPFGESLSPVTTTEGVRTRFGLNIAGISPNPALPALPAPPPTPLILSLFVIFGLSSIILISHNGKQSVEEKIKLSLNSHLNHILCEKKPPRQRGSKSIMSMA